ncbi:hypothetical protein AAG658_06635 [Bacillus subtilis]
MDIFKERERIPGSYLDYSAADRVEGDQLEITKSSGFGDVWIKDTYGFEHEERDY